jgi:capsular exopolysaccharide synthesis family protein
MQNQPLLDDPSHKRTGHGATLVAPPQYIEAPYAEVMEDAGPGLLLEYWGMAHRHWTTLGVSAFLGLLAALLLTLPQTPVYRARTSLEIQNLNENFLNMRNVNPTVNDEGSSSSQADLQTQVKILQSDSVLAAVVAKLNVDKKIGSEEDRGRLSAWRKALGLAQPKSVSPREAALSVVNKNLKVQTVAGTRLVEILYDSTDPQLAADFANTLTAEFIQQNLEARWKTTQQTGEWLTRQMEDVRIKLEKSEDELQSYARATGLLFTLQKVGTQLIEDNVAEDKLRQLQEELSRAHGDRVAKQSVYESAAKTPPESLPEVLDDKTLGEYQVRLTDLRRQLAELSSALTPAHPSVKKVQAQVAALESAVETKRNNLVERIRNEFQAAQRRENLLARNYATQAQLVTEQAAEVAHYNILKSDVDTNRQLYDSMLSSVQEAGMTSALRASNIRVVDSALPPTRPYKPKLVLNSGLGLLAGVFFGFVFVVVRERADRSIQAPGEAGFSLGVPELGVIPAAGAERSRYFAYYRDTEKRKLETENSKLETRRPLVSLGLSDGSRVSESGTRDQGSSGNRSAMATSVTPTNGNGHRTIGHGQRIELAAAGHSALAESFRATLTSILFCGENGDRPRVIVVTSAGASEGKTTVASNLALAVADTGSPVLLIDGDLRKGRLHEVYDVSNDWGFSDALAGNALPEGRAAAYVETRYPRLFLVPAGPTSPSISGLLYAPRTLEFLRLAREHFHIVIVDSPPMLNMADARVLGKMADGVVLVVRASQTTRDDAATAAQRLMDDGSRVLGTILNEWDPRHSSHTGYAHRYPYYQGTRDQ